MGPLSGYKIIELAGLGPAPFCAMLLADMGAQIVRVDRPGGSMFDAESNAVNRGRRSLVLDMKSPRGLEVFFRLIADADALIEGFRPGVMERLGIGPEPCLARNAKLVYGRMTGWGQSGPLASRAGHDINYIALSGALHAIGDADRPPPPPLNLLGDYAGGGMLLAMGILAAFVERGNSGKGQVVDAAMLDGSAQLMTVFYGMKAAGRWHDTRGSNLLDGAAPFYRCYVCRDGKYLAVGPLEPQFYRSFLQGIGIDAKHFADPFDSAQWPLLGQAIATRLREKSRDEWCELLAEIDACVAPVLDLDEAPRHPHNRARKTFVDHNGVTQPAPAPRFSRTPGAIQSPPPRAGAHTDEILQALGFDAAEIAALKNSGVVD